jgi:hypothetical protein
MKTGCILPHGCNALRVDLMLPVVLEKIKDLGLKDTPMLRRVDDLLAYARSLDFQDPLAGFRQEFVIADPNTIYLMATRWEGCLCGLLR